MKNILVVLGLCALTAACGTGATDGTSLTTMGKMKSCLTEQAMQTLTDGSLYTNGIKTTAKTISQSCIKSLAMENLGIDAQTTQMATTILSAMQATKQ